MQTTAAPESPSAGLTLLGQIAAQTSAASSGGDTVSSSTGSGGSEVVSSAAADGAAASKITAIGDSANNAATPATTAPPPAVPSPLDPCLAAANNGDSNKMAPVVAESAASSPDGSCTSATPAAAGTKRPATAITAASAAAGPPATTLQPTAAGPAYRIQRHCRGWHGEKYEALIHRSNYDALRKAHVEKTTLADQYPLTTFYSKWSKYDEFEVRKEGPAGTAGSSYVIRSKKCRTELPPSRRAILCTECGALAKALGDMNGHANREKEQQQYAASSKLNAIKVTRNDELTHGGTASDGDEAGRTK